MLTESRRVQARADGSSLAYISTAIGNRSPYGRLTDEAAQTPNRLRELHLHGVASGFKPEVFNGHQDN